MPACRFYTGRDPTGPFGDAEWAPGMSPLLCSRGSVSTYCGRDEDSTGTRGTSPLLCSRGSVSAYCGRDDILRGREVCRRSFAVAAQCRFTAAGRRFHGGARYVSAPLQSRLSVDLLRAGRRFHGDARYVSAPLQSRLSVDLLRAGRRFHGTRRMSPLLDSRGSQPVEMRQSVAVRIRRPAGTCPPGPGDGKPIIESRSWRDDPKCRNEPL